LTWWTKFDSRVDIDGAAAEAWHRHITLAMLAAAFPAVTAHTERGRTPPRPQKRRQNRSRSADPVTLQRNQLALGHSHPPGAPTNTRPALVSLAPRRPS